MVKKLIAALLLATASPAFAQQQQTPTEQAMGAKIMQEMQAGLNCNVNLISVQTALDKAQERIKELESEKSAEKTKP